MQTFPQDKCLTLRNINQGFIIAYFLSKNLHNQGQEKGHDLIIQTDCIKLVNFQNNCAILNFLLVLPS